MDAEEYNLREEDDIPLSHRLLTQVMESMRRGGRSPPHHLLQSGDAEETKRVDEQEWKGEGAKGPKVGERLCKLGQPGCDLPVDPPSTGHSGLQKDGKGPAMSREEKLEPRVLDMDRSDKLIPNSSPSKYGKRGVGCNFSNYKPSSAHGWKSNKAGTFNLDISESLEDSDYEDGEQYFDDDGFNQP